MENASKPGADRGVQTAAPCFRKTVGEEATFMESAKDRFRQFKDAPAAEHWACLRRKVRSVFGEPTKASVSAVDGAASKDGSKISS